MAYESNQNDIPLPADTQNEVSGTTLIPKYFRTDTNKKFIGSTIDQMIQPGVVEKLNFYAGRRFAKATQSDDIFMRDVSNERENYQFEPYAVYKDELENVKFLKDYRDYINSIKNFKGSVSNESLLNAQEFYAWNPNIDWDKFSNFREYYWVPNGPAPIAVFGQSKEIVSTIKVEIVPDDQDNPYVFFPDGKTKNPNIKLFKGQTYKFEINTPGQPFAFSSTRSFTTSDLKYENVFENDNHLITEGITIYEYNAEGKLVLSNKKYIEEGVIEYTIPETAPEIFYYISSSDLTSSGIVTSYEFNENTSINIEEEILGKKTYKTSTGIELSNGMKLFFQGDVTPEKYNNSYFYVEGVGTSIKLVSDSDLIIPAVFTSDLPIPFDTLGFDSYAFEDAASFPGEKDYITINRSSPDKNPWSRYNRWFHRSVLIESAEAANITLTLDQSLRATRPIIEFEAGLKLFNYGSKSKTDVSLVDDFTKDVFSTIEGKLGYNVDGEDIADGMRILFTADTDPFVSGKIFEVRFVIHNGRRQISLIETEDTNPEENDTVLSLMGDTYKGKMFYYNGTKWNQAQDKLTVNQPPKFDLFNHNGVSLSDPIVYKSNTFVGSKLFSYKEGNSTVDSELGFSLQYRSIANVGDILFDFNLLSDTLTYQDDDFNIITANTDNAFLKKYDATGELFVYECGWKKAKNKSKQACIRQYNIVTGNEEILVDVFENSANLSDLVVKVFINGVRNNNFTITGTEIAKINLDSNISKGDSVVLKCYSNSPKTDNGFWEIPINLEKNPLNQNITEFTLGEVNDHVDSIVEDHPNYVGTYPGLSNLRDLSDPTVYGTRFVQHSGPINLPLYHLADKNANLIKSIKFARNEYAKFKKLFFSISEKTGFDGNVREHVDLIISQIVKNKTIVQPFYFSDMIGIGASTRTVNEVEFSNTQYFALGENFDLETLSTKAVNVYLNGTQLIHGKDYSFVENSFVFIERETLEGDIIEIVEYESTNGSFIPPTPSKLGLYPTFEPQKLSDSTYFRTTEMLQGHDGSLIRSFNDYRDDLFLELESRIYNNIKSKYNTDLLDIFDIINNKHRDTGVQKNILDTALTADFNTWLDSVGRPNFSEHSFYDRNNSFTFNYSSTTDSDNIPLQGFWRNVYKTYFDTDRPHSHPWECLGFSKKPNWWDEQYGIAPYTKNNTNMWQDIEQGIIRDPNEKIVKNKKFAKPGISKYIPVNDQGNLISPLDSGLAKNFNTVNAQRNFNFGDHAPVENAWRKSSDFPFAFITAWVLTQPAHFVGLGFDVSRMQRNISGNINYLPSDKSINLKDIVLPTISLDDDLRLTSGLINYIANYIQNSVTSKYDSYKETLQGLTNQLGIKLGGYADKSKLKLVLDSRSPLNKTSVFVPDENYDIILNTSSAVDIVTFSGVIIEKAENGFVISGYDRTSPAFTYYPPVKRQVDGAITVGGISEDFVEWGERQNYISGTVIRYEGAFYRVKTAHRSTDEFNLNLYTTLQELPIKGGITAQLRNNFLSEPEQLIYGTQLDTYQDVVDFLLGYEKYLTSQGFTFDYFNKESEVLEDMKLCVNEFLFWITQNWDTGTVLTVSPLANQVLFSRDFTVVDDVFDTFYDSNLLTGNGITLSREFTNVFRDNRNQFGLRPINSDDGIFLVKLPLVQKEHIVLIDNATVFNDVIYNLAPGYRQERIKVVGYRTDDWNGSLNIPGFVYDNVIVENWNTYTDYDVADVVKYKEFYYSAEKKHSSTEFFDTNLWSLLNEKPTSQLLPNWDYRVNQFTDFYDLDTDNFDTEQQRLGQHLIGYQERPYLSNIITDSVSQYKFYQGYIADKGTKNALTKLFDALSSAETDSLEFFEEWALRLGQYGALDNLQEIEYQLDEKYFKLEPQLFDLVSAKNANRTDLVYEIPKYEVYLNEPDYSHTPFKTLTGNKSFVYDAGYVNENDVDIVVDQIEDLTNEEYTYDEIPAGGYVWVKKYSNTWNVLKNVQTDLTITDIQEEIILGEDDLIDTRGFRVTLNRYPDWQKGDIIGLKSSNNDLNGFYKVQSVTLDTVGFYGDLDIEFDTFFDDSTTLSATKFVSRRFSDANDLNINVKELVSERGDKVWLDNTTEGTWGVFNVSPTYNLQEELLNPTGEGDGFGVSFDSNKENTILAVSTASEYYDELGTVRIYTRVNEIFEKELLQEIESPVLNPICNFGQSIAMTPDGIWLAVSAPLASNVESRFVGNLTENVSYVAGDIVRDRGVLWRAIKDISLWQSIDGDQSTISSTDESWEPVYVLERNTEGNQSDYEEQGCVFLYKKGQSGRYTLRNTILSPNPDNFEHFGWKLMLRNDAQNNPKLFVGAPGVIGSDRGKVYILDFLNDRWEYSFDRDFKGEYSEFSRYNTGNIVLYNGDLYTASTNMAAGTALPTNDNFWIDIDNDTIEYTPYLPRQDQSLSEDGGAGTFANTVNVGVKFDVSDFGDLIALGAQKTGTLANKIVMYAKTGNRYSYVDVLDSADTLEDFGWDFSLDNTGYQIAVAAPRNDINATNSGCVYIYELSGNIDEYTYQLHQTIRSVYPVQSEAFGWAVEFKDGKLAIAGKNTDLRKITTFDKYAQKLADFYVGDDIDGRPIYADWINDPTSQTGNETQFDQNTTVFGETIPYRGVISMYQKIGDFYVYSEDIEYDRNTRFEDITNFKIINNHFYISFPELNSRASSDNELTPQYSYSEDSSLGILVDLRSDKNVSTWTATAEATGKVDISRIKQVFMYSKTKNELLFNLDFIDPRQGKIPAPAEQEITYKTFYDPAIYSVNDPDTQTEEVRPNIILDNLSNWGPDQVGTLWWNLSNASWINPYQGSIQYRATNFNKLAPNSTIDIFEWVESDYTPEVYAEIADTPVGYSEGISGTPVYDDLTHSYKEVYDSVSGKFVNKYYFWVKNRKIIPALPNRQLTSTDIANLIADPAGSGYRFINLINDNQFAIHNAKSLVEDTDTLLHFDILDNPNLRTKTHTEYGLLTEGLGYSKPNADIEQKWFDSLIGYDKNNKDVPDRNLTAKQKYGILNHPRQSMFVNRIEAVKQLVERSNYIMSQYQLVDNINLEKFLDFEVAPSASTNLYDSVVSTKDQLNFVGLAKIQSAIVTPIIDKGKITRVRIDNSGRGYLRPPTITIFDTSGNGAILFTEINNLGQITNVIIRSAGTNYSNNTQLQVRKYSVLVEQDDSIDERWSIYEYDVAKQLWNRTKTQSYNTKEYWNYIDWFATGYTNLTPIDFVVDQSYELFKLNDQIGDIVKIKNVGTGGWLLLRKIDNQLVEDYTVNYETIGRQNGTIQLRRTLYSYSYETSGYDANIYDFTVYDREPIIELNNILLGLKEDVFIGELESEWNNLFFTSIRYILSEQPYVDWVYKSSFVKAKHNLGQFSQRRNFQNDNLENYQDYVNEVKPFKAKIREYISAYSQLEPTNTLITDFDLPPSYDENTKEIEPSNAKIANHVITNLLDRYTDYPFKSWTDNNAYDVIEIKVYDAGEGYIASPVVTVEGDYGTTARAFISNGKVSEIEITNKGGKYYTPPKINIEGNIKEGGKNAKAVAILGNSVVRNFHFIMKFDRIQGAYYIMNIDETESFTGSGSANKYNLSYPINVKTDTFNVTINGKQQLKTTYAVYNVTETDDDYTYSKGVLQFDNDPAVNDEIVINYKKDITMLHAADRINYFYQPTTGMKGKNLSQLMDGVEYDGALYDSIDFGNVQGFDIGGFGSLPWDTFDNTYDDEVFVMDGSTEIFTLSKPLELDIEYNVYVKRVTETEFTRIDSPNYDGSSLDGDVIMYPIIGNGEQDVVALDPIINLSDGDIVIIRKSTSDGSQTPTAQSYDTALQGGIFESTSATGFNPEDIIVDGDGFVTLTTSKGPEELVPGQVLDTLDIKVYTRASEGVGVIGTVTHIIDPEVQEYKLPVIPYSIDALFVKVDNQDIDNTHYNVNWSNNTLEWADSTSMGLSLSIVAIGAGGGTTMSDSGTYNYKGNFTTAGRFNDEISALVSVNGVIKIENTDYRLIQTGVQVSIEFINEPIQDAIVTYAIYDSEIQTYSQIRRDNTFIPDGETHYYKFPNPEFPSPYNKEFLASSIIVKKNDTVLRPSYGFNDIITEERDYKLETWAIDNPSKISNDEIFVFIDNEQLDFDEFTYDPVTTLLTLRTNELNIGKQLGVYLNTDAEYYFVDTQVSVESDDNLSLLLNSGESVDLIPAENPHDPISLTIQEVGEDYIIFESFSRTLRDTFDSDDTNFRIDLEAGDSTRISITGIKFILSNNLTFDTAPEIDDKIEIITFSNHDINNFNRIDRIVRSTTIVDEGTVDYYNRNFLTAGIIPLRTVTQASQYAWVALNGDVLRPNVDYIVDKHLNAVRLTNVPIIGDIIDILEFGNPSITPVFGYRIFKDILNRTHYKRLNQNNSYILASDLNYYDKEIVLEDTSGMFNPSKENNIPGVLYVNSERIEYFEINGNTVSQLRRGTLGTGTNNFLALGTRLYGQGIEENIEYTDTIREQKFVASGGENPSTEFMLNFTPLSVDQIEVIVGGKRMRKNAIDIFNSTLALNSPDGDETVPADYTLNGNTLTFRTAPAANLEETQGIQIQIFYKTGKIFNDIGKTLLDSENEVATFITDATIDLPK